jgi:hypothetical protein
MMKLPRIAARLPLSLIAVATGWAASMVVTLPVQYAKIAVNATGGAASFFWSLAEGTMVWGIWSLAVAAGGWLFGLVPVIAIVPESWLLRHPRSAIAVAALLGWIVVLVEFRVWELVLPYHSLGVRAFVLYSSLLVVYASVSAAVYVRLIVPKASPGAPASLA